MPVLSIYGLEAVASYHNLIELKHELIPNAVASIQELGIGPEHVSVFLVMDLLTLNTGANDVIVFIDALAVKPERTDAVKKRLTEAVANVVHEYILHYSEGGTWRLIEVQIRSEMTDKSIYTMITPDTTEQLS